MSKSNILRRGATRRAAQAYIDDCERRGYHPTTAEIVDAAMNQANHMTIYGLVKAIRQWTMYEVTAMMREVDPATRLRRYLLQLAPDGERRWYAHGQMSFDGLDNSGRFVTRPQADNQARAERRRDIERAVVEAAERELHRPVSVDEVWPEIEAELRRAGLL